MAKYTITELETLLDSATAKLPSTTSKKMFGCHATWVEGNVFALVWKHGRIGFKLPDPAPYEALLGLAGAEPWKAGPMQMSHWVLVPETFHAKPAELRKWATKAHELCAKLEKKAKPKKAAKAPVKSGAKRGK